MKPFEYIRVTTIDEACAVLAEKGARTSILAGGTDLLVGWRRPASPVPGRVLDIGRIRELGGISESDDTIHILPLTTHAQILGSGLLRRISQLLPIAASTIGSPQIRNRGTIGGNLLNAAPCADLVPPLLALGAVVTLRSKGGTRQLNIADLYLKPYQTAARPDELLIDIAFPRPAERTRGTFIKLGRRNALAISRLSIAAMLNVGNDGRIADARIVPGAAFPIWQRVTEAEQLLLGEKPSDKLFRAAGRKASEAMVACTGRRWSTEYKERVLEVLVRRALEQCSTAPLPVPGAERSVPWGFTEPAGASNTRSSEMRTVEILVNGRRRNYRVEPNRTLLEFLRTDLGLTGTKCGCEIGECGACTVLLDGRPVNSCLLLAVQADGSEVSTVEGLMRNGLLHPLQQSFIDHDAVHCGFCTPGMLMSARGLLDLNPRPTDADIREAISGNLCRCTGYVQIVDAVKGAQGPARYDQSTLKISTEGERSGK